MEVTQEYNVRKEQSLERQLPLQVDDLLAIAMQEIAPFFFGHNAEADVCDLLLELEKLEEITRFVDKKNAQRICLYLASCVSYEQFPENVTILKVRKMQEMRFALFLLFG